MERLSDACPSSQRAYEKRAGVTRRTAYAIGPEAPHGPDQTAVAQDTARQRGRSFFRLTRPRRPFGRPGRTYLAWQLPNEYTGPHQRLSRSRMKRMNRTLADLLVNGMTGTTNVRRPSGRHRNASSTMRRLSGRPNDRARPAASATGAARTAAGMRVTNDSRSAAPEDTASDGRSLSLIDVEKTCAHDRDKAMIRTMNTQPISAHDPCP
ncbi:MAG: hypothetical protein R3C44_23400 [Chloroflexota bacterium]